METSTLQLGGGDFPDFLPHFRYVTAPQWHQQLGPKGRLDLDWSCNVHHRLCHWLYQVLEIGIDMLLYSGGYRSGDGKWISIHRQIQ